MRGHAEACWQEVEADKLRFGDLGRMPRRIIHPDKPLDRGWDNWIFAGWEAWRGHRAAYVMGLGRWPVAYLHCGQPWIYGILERRVWLRRLVEQLGQQPGSGGAPGAASTAQVLHQKQ